MEGSLYGKYVTAYGIVASTGPMPKSRWNGSIKAKLAVTIGVCDACVPRRMRPKKALEAIVKEMLTTEKYDPQSED